MLSVPIIIEEYAGIDRVNEPVSVGIPFPKGLIKDTSRLVLLDPDDGSLPIQIQVLATWPDKSPKWVLLDFQTSINANVTKELEVTWNDAENKLNEKNHIKTKVDKEFVQVDTGEVVFFLNNKVFKPFERVLVDGNEILDSNKNSVVLTDESCCEHEGLIETVIIETPGPLRTTLKVEGQFKAKQPNQLNESNRPNQAIASFFSRIHFFAGLSMIRLEFTVRNPRAAMHPGGLWDLGDPGSVLFRDLSIHTALNCRSAQPKISYYLKEDPVPMDYQSVNQSRQPSAISYKQNGDSHLRIYQDSSGGENWKSHNHVNRNGEVKNCFRGYRIYWNGEITKEGLRANPSISIHEDGKRISGIIQHFWQNFPKALDAKDNTLTIRFFPEYHNDVFELQGGEQKTHTVILEFGLFREVDQGFGWIDSPIIPRSTPEWYAKTKAFDYLMPENEALNGELRELISVAIKGNNTFFRRRERVDEYGWRNFGEFYADHESVGHDGPVPLVSHYNNQYDCIYGMLLQFVRSGDMKWFLLGDQLCNHVKDIDIYHTNNDRPEYNHGLFWHTEHYIDAQTATHRCFSRRHADQKNMAVYGGGPALSHNYSTGLLYHYYITGEYSSLETVNELSSYVESNIDFENTMSNHIIKGIRKCSSGIKRKKNALVQLTKVYGLSGPSRTSGNALNTLMDAYSVTNKEEYLQKAEDLILSCIHPRDNIDKRDLLDVENKWMYTIFLQSLGRYLDFRMELDRTGQMWEYARQSLLHYAEWMVENEDLYLGKPEKLEYPNETWAIQDMRKCNVLLYAAKYGKPRTRQMFMEKADYFYRGSVGQLKRFDTKSLTRPIILLIQNLMMYDYFRANESENIIIGELDEKTESIDGSGCTRKRLLNRYKRIVKSLRQFSIEREVEFIKWRIR